MIRVPTILLLCLLWLYTRQASASESLVTELHNDPQWLALLEMRKKNTASGYKSEVDQSSFFLSGTTDDPAQEMAATIRQFNTDPTTWCRFPARGIWLSRHALIKSQPVLTCPELEQWRSAIPTQRLILVFPSVYLNSASSMFGHTFLRFENTNDPSSSPLLSKSVSYYADMSEQVNSFDYIFKGIFGGFKGTLDVMPYYEMIRKYNANEDRDIWEYTLSYSSDDIKLLIDHLWEIRGHSFDYYFFDENCSYRILSFLDIITPNHDMKYELRNYVTPIDTIRVLKIKGVVTNIKYIPSSTKIIRKELERLPSVSVQKINDFIHNKTSALNNELTTKEASIVVQAISLSIHQHGATAEQENMRHTLFDRLLSEPSQPDTVRQLYITQPAIPPEDGHLNRKIELGYGHQDDFGNFTEVTWQETYHDLYDPPGGYEKGVSLAGPSITMRYFPEKNWQLQKINLLSITSLNPIDQIFTPLSWKLDINRKRDFIEEHTTLANNADFHLGLTYNDRRGIYWFAMGGAGITHTPVFEKPLVASLSTRVGFVYQEASWALYLHQGNKKYFQGNNSSTGSTVFTITKQIDKNLAVRIEYENQDSANSNIESFSTNISKYF